MNNDTTPSDSQAKRLTDPKPANAWEEKQAAKKARLERAAERASREAEDHFGRASRIVDGIPLGQPILIGHHSEKRHRRDLERMRSSMDAGVAAQRRAEDYERRADSVGRGGISSDDPDAILKLEAELKEVEDRQALMKRVNAAHKRFLKDPASLDGEDFPEAVKQRIRTYKPAYSWEPHPFAPFQLTNNSANARRIRLRIAELQKRARTPAAPERTVNGVRVVDNVEANRLQLFFPGKPDAETRAKLKRHGFRFTPSIGAWQTHRSNRARWAASTVLGVDLSKPDTGCTHDGLARPEGG